MSAAVAIREGYGRALAEYGAVDAKVVVLDADTASSTFSCYFAERFPDRFFNVGIAEPCMVDMAVGFALGGKVPFVNAFAALLSLRALEQVRTCVCYARANVKLVGGFAGVSDFKDGPTHHSITDLAIMRALPGMTVIVPADATEAARWVPIVAALDGPVFMRVSRGSALPAGNEGLPLEVGRGLVLRAGRDVTLVATGTMVGRCLKAADELRKMGAEARVLEIHTLKPIDADLICRAAEETGALVSAEEHSVVGGLGGAVAEVLSEGYPAPLERVGIADRFTHTGPSPEALMDAFGLSVESIVAAARRAMGRKRGGR
ncbi:MAG TPA: transketolase C-terminal domain-containing protein [Anaeromyxobacter sp.]|nr:transketolase C-terminal domain-containing protein [Anaeromyxobacter sp.]